MGATLFEQLARGQAPPHIPLTVTHLRRMIEAGWLPEGEPVELDGVLVHKDRSAAGEDRLTHGKRHATAVAMLRRLDRVLEGRGCHLRTQLPVTLSETSEPEPDGAIVVGADDGYVDRHPGPGDVLVVVEVADSSLCFDEGAKLQLYAAAGIPVYVIVDLPAERVPLYREPETTPAAYRARRENPRGETIELPVRSQTVAVPVSDFLPA